MGGSTWEMSAWSFIKIGGPLMAPILFCSFVALGIVIEKLIYFSSLKIDLIQFKSQVFERVKQNRIKESIQLCDECRAPVAKIMKAGLMKFGSSRETIKESMEDASLFEIPKLENRLNALATIAHIAPLLGLLGTVTGMMTIFHTIQIRAASLNPVTPGDLAGGIGEALITTVAGLMVAIPTYVAYNYCVHRVDRFVLEMEHAATEIINFFSQITDSSSREL